MTFLLGIPRRFTVQTLPLPWKQLMMAESQRYLFIATFYRCCAVQDMVSVALQREYQILSWAWGSWAENTSRVTFGVSTSTP
jgi:hypothetical protein